MLLSVCYANCGIFRTFARHEKEVLLAERFAGRSSARMPEPRPESCLSGKIQGDGRKFLDRFKSYFRSKISQSLNEIHIYRLQPKSATKGEFFSYIFLSLIVRDGACCPLTYFPSNNVNASLVQILARQTTQRSQTAIFSVHFPWFLIAVACLTRPLT